jgi:hypothetical protein
MKIPLRRADGHATIETPEAMLLEDDGGWILGHAGTAS